MPKNDRSRSMTSTPAPSGTVAARKIAAIAAAKRSGRRQKLKMMPSATPNTTARGGRVVGVAGLHGGQRQGDGDADEDRRDPVEHARRLLRAGEELEDGGPLLERARIQRAGQDDRQRVLDEALEDDRREQRVEDAAERAAHGHAQVEVGEP